MTCATCGLQRQWHGSDHGRPGTHLAETGCHDGVMMDDDEHAEGWQRGVIYPPCPKNPDRCSACDGSGEAGPEVTTQDDCPACNGTGWKDGKARWPVPADLPLSTRVLARMHRAYQRGTGCRLSAEELDALSTEIAGEWMSSAAERRTPNRLPPIHRSRDAPPSSPKERPMSGDGNHQGADILTSLYAAWDKVPASPILACISGAIQEIEALRTALAESERKLVEAEASLQPFADVAEFMLDFNDGDFSVELPGGYQLTMKPFYVAKEILSTPSQETTNAQG